VEGKGQVVPKGLEYDQLSLSTMSWSFWLGAAGSLTSNKLTANPVISPLSVPAMPTARR